jgi:hypothetical protein
LLSYDPAGQFRWSAQLPGATALAQVAIDTWGDIVVGALASSSAGYFAKYAANGSLRWTRTHAGLGPWDMGVEADGDITLVSHALGTPIQNPNLSQPLDMVVSRLDASGDLRWSHTIDHNGGSDFIGGLVVATDGRIGLAGFTYAYLGQSYAPGDALAVELIPQSRSFCFGDGLGTACPCGNASPGGAQAGCLNSTGVGARLVDGGGASIVADSLVMTASGVTGPGLFFQGTTKLVGGAGTSFGDGLRCVGGAVIRLGIVAPTGSTASHPGGGGTPIHVAGSATAGDVRHYQVWYRNSAPFCTASTFNLTNGLTITWGP